MLPLVPYFVLAAANGRRKTKLCSRSARNAHLRNAISQLWGSTDSQLIE